MNEILEEHLTVDRLLHRRTGSEATSGPRPVTSSRLRHLDLLPVGVLAALSCVVAFLEFGYLYH